MDCSNRFAVQHPTQVPETEDTVNERQATAQLAQLLADFSRGEVKDLPGALRAMADQIGSNGAPDPKQGKAATREAILRVFEHWRVTTGHHRARQTAGRLTAIRARLREGYAEADLFKAIEGCASSDFHRKGGHDDLTLICRNGEMVEKFCTQAGHELGTGGDQMELGETEDLKRQLRQARDEGRTKDYERINKELAAALRGDRG